jgi:hypothetical protein
MNVLKIPVLLPSLFWVTATVWSVFQAHTGYRTGLWIYDNSGSDKSKKYVRQLAYGVHHAAFYGICSFVGFLAWRGGLAVSGNIADWSNLSGGSGSLLIALAVIAISGISGALPRILYLGGRPA